VTSEQLKPRTIAQALTATGKLIWKEADSFTRRQLAYSLLLLLAASLLSALYPVIYKLAIDALSGHADPTVLIAPGFLVAGLVLCNYTLGLSMGVRQLVHGLGVQRLNRRISNELFGHIVRLPLQFHLDRKTGAIGETISQGLNGCQIILQHAVSSTPRTSGFWASPLCSTATRSGGLRRRFRTHLAKSRTRTWKRRQPSLTACSTTRQ
jgi:ABC-type multidrug transport system fused ATPase/permease subunit